MNRGKWFRIDAIPVVIAELQRLMEQHNYTNAPTISQYKHLRQPGMPSPYTALRQAGCTEDSAGWAKFVEERLGLSVEDRSTIVQKASENRANEQAKKVQIGELFQYDTDESYGYQVSSYRIVGNKIYCELR